MPARRKFGSSSSCPSRVGGIVKEGDCVLALKGSYRGKTGIVTKVEERPGFLGMRRAPKYQVTVYHGWEPRLGRPIYETYTLREIKIVSKEQCKR
jgi:hypothetical protein